VNIDLKQLEGLLEVLETRDVSEFEFEDEKMRVHFEAGAADRRRGSAGAPGSFMAGKRRWAPTVLR